MIIGSAGETDGDVSIVMALLFEADGDRVDVGGGGGSMCDRLLMDGIRSVVPEAA